MDQEYWMVVFPLASNLQSSRKKDTKTVKLFLREHILMNHTKRKEKWNLKNSVLIKEIMKFLYNFFLSLRIFLYNLETDYKLKSSFLCITKCSLATSCLNS